MNTLLYRNDEIAIIGLDSGEIEIKRSALCVGDMNSPVKVSCISIVIPRVNDFYRRGEPFRDKLTLEAFVVETKFRRVKIWVEYYPPERRWYMLDRVIEQSVK